MPIRHELRKFYGREWRTITRPRILARAGNKCEQCKIPNGNEGLRVGGAWMEIRAVFGRPKERHVIWHGNDGAVLTVQPEGYKRHTRAQLGVAHLNHVAGDDRDENLKALCRWCHLNYDALHHKETRAIRKDAARPLLKSAQEWGAKFEAIGRTE